MPFDNLGGPERDPDDADLLIAARSLIGLPHLWVKNAYCREGLGTMRYCAMAALSTVCERPFLRPGRRVRRLARLLVNEMPNQGGYLLRFVSAPLRVRGYNDSFATSHDDVLTLFDKAINRLAPYRSSWPVYAHLLHRTLNNFQT